MKFNKSQAAREELQLQATKICAAVSQWEDGISPLDSRFLRGSRNKWLLMGIVQQDRPNLPQCWQTARSWKLKTETPPKMIPTIFRYPKWSRRCKETTSGLARARNRNKNRELEVKIKLISVNYCSQWPRRKLDTFGDSPAFHKLWNFNDATDIYRPAGKLAK